MKTFFIVLKTVFLTVASIIGAGFITGAELVGFFGADGFYPFMVLSALLFFPAFLLAYYFGTKRKTTEEINALLFSRPKAVNIALLLSSFFSLCATLSALDTLFSVFGLPVLSVLCLTLSCVFSGRGIAFIEKASTLLMPPVVIAVLCAAAGTGVDFGAAFTGGFVVKTAKCFLFVFMNIFVNFPVISAAAYGKGKSTLIISAAVVSVILFAVGITVSATVKYAGDGAQAAPMPVIAAFSGKSFFPLLSAAILCCLISSAFTAFYPVCLFAKTRAGTLGTVLAAAVCFCFSRLGIKNIVDYAYPLSGVFGAIYLFRCAVVFMKGIKDKKGRIIVFGGKKYVKKKKQKQTC